MRVTVAIPTHNSERVIHSTLSAVLSQTRPPDEILVLDDGSTDATVSLLENAYGNAIHVIQQENRGLSATHNALCKLATGDLVAFLDHDDIWHPTYLDVQTRHFQMFPHAAAFYAGHVDFYGYGDYNWPSTESANTSPEIISPIGFLERYHTTSGHFSSMSFLCLPREVLTRIGTEPFGIGTDPADDVYLALRLPLIGDVCYSAAPLVAYRITENSLSSNKLHSFAALVNIYDASVPRYAGLGLKDLARLHRKIVGSKHREYGKRLMGAGEYARARRELLVAVVRDKTPISVLKSVALLGASILPMRLQPDWPEPYRLSQDPRVSQIDTSGRTQSVE